MKKGKTQKLGFKKSAIVELNDDNMLRIFGGTNTVVVPVNQRTCSIQACPPPDTK